MKKVLHHPLYIEKITTVKGKRIKVIFSPVSPVEFNKENIQTALEPLGITILPSKPCKSSETVNTKPINTTEDTITFDETALLKALESFAILFKIYIEYKKKYHTKYLHNFYYIHIDDAITVKRIKQAKKYLFSFYTAEIAYRFLAENFELIQNVKPLYQ